LTASESKIILCNRRLLNSKSTTTTLYALGEKGFRVEAISFARKGEDKVLKESDVCILWQVLT